MGYLDTTKRVLMPSVKLKDASVFFCREGQTILSAALEQGIGLEYSCRTGRCKTCAANLLQGSTKRLEEDLERNGPAVNSPILTCLDTPTTDISLDIEARSELTGVVPRLLPCRITELKKLSDNIQTVLLKLPPKQPFMYLPGQYVDVIAPNGIRRSYSIANPPDNSQQLLLHIQRVPAGEMSDFWFNQAEEGDLLRLEGPFGSFFLREQTESGGSLICLATGTGMAPIKSILEYLQESEKAQPFKRIALYWGLRNLNDVYWHPDFPTLENFTYTPVFSREASAKQTLGYIQDVALRDFSSLTQTMVYAAGSERMTESARRQFLDAGLNPAQFISDAFVCSAKNR